MKNIKNVINWKLYLVLFSITFVSIIAVLPYAFTLAAETLKQVSVPLPIIVIVSIIQSSILFAIILFFWLLLSKKLGLSPIILEEYIITRKLPLNIKSLLKTSIIFGIIAGISIIILDYIFTISGSDISLWSWQMPPFRMGILASLYGGISEEILLRLFFMSFLIWLLSLLKKSNENILNNNYIMWSSIIISSVLFGLWHLPITWSVTTITFLVVLRAIVLNGVWGIIFGRLYWKKGFESAVISHFSADIVLHAIFPLLLFFI